MRPILGLVTYLQGTRVWLFAHPASLGTVAGALVFGSLAGLPAGEKMYDYMWADPRFCDDCHVHDYANEAWANGVHGRLTTCHDCHRVPIRHYPKNLYLAVFDRPQTPEDIPRPEVGVVICEQCHLESGAVEPLTGPMPDDLRRLLVRVDDSPLHTLHLESKTREPTVYQGGKPASSHGAGPQGVESPAGAGAEHGEGEAGIVCLDCHGGLHLDVHRFTATSTACETCHEGIRPADESGRPLSCLDCHATGFLDAS